MSSENNDDLVSQFMAFTGCADAERAQSYLEMSGMNVETAVGLFMEHQGNNSNAALGGAAGAAGMAAPNIRAPDQTRTMRLMDDVMAPRYADIVDDQDMVMNAFADIDARAAVNAAAAAMDGDSKEDDAKQDDDVAKADEFAASAGLSDMFAPPSHLMHRGGGFQGARSVAKDARRWLLVNIQRDSEFSCHALNRDVWRDELVENLVRMGFIFWQAMDDSSEGRTYSERYKVFDYPHIAIIDPRTGRSLWKKEGWTQEKPFMAEQFSEMAMDFCSRHSFDKPPLGPTKKPAAASGSASGSASRPGSGPANGHGERKRPFMSEQEQLQAAMAASLKPGDAPDDGTENIDVDPDADADEYEMEDGDDEVECLGNRDEMVTTETVQEEKPPSFAETLLAITVGDEPEAGARIQLRMPDATRLVRKFDKSDPVKTIYAFIAQHNDQAKEGKEFMLMAGFPPKNLEGDIDSTIDSCGLNGQAVSVRWKD